jgi:hypothetical protein
MRFVCGVLARRFFGFVPGWLALILVLGGIAAATPPVSHINIISDASQNQSGGTGFIGPAVVAQATAAPTPQPGNPYVNDYIMGDGIANGIWELCNDCTAGIGAGNYALGHYHVLWVTNPGDATAPADVALGGCALCAGDASTTGQNVALGVGTLENKTDHTPITGNSNVAIGNIALGYLTSGSSNIALGAGSGECISSGSSNFIMGDGLSTGAGGCTADHNVLLGPEAGFKDATSTGMVAVGWNAGQNVTGGTDNVFLGWNSGQNASSTIANSVFIGSQAGQAATGNLTVAIGSTAGQNATGSDGVFIGDGAGSGAASSDGTRTVAIGASAGHAMTTGNHNVFVGFQSGFNATSGGTNTAVGYQSLSSATTGGNNVAVGNAACTGLTTGTWNVCIGNNAALPSASANGQMSIANAIYGFGNSTSTTGISTGCIAFYQTSCTNGTVASAVPYVAPNGAAASCTGGYTFANGIMVISGAGAPTCTAPAASEYLRSDGASGSHIYISQGGGTWTAIAGV